MRRVKQMKLNCGKARTPRKLTNSAIANMNRGKQPWSRFRVSPKSSSPSSYVSYTQTHLIVPSCYSDFLCSQFPPSQHPYSTICALSSRDSIQSSRHSTRIPPHRQSNSRVSQGRLLGSRDPCSCVVAVHIAVVAGRTASAVVVVRRILRRCICQLICPYRLCRELDVLCLLRVLGLPAVLRLSILGLPAILRLSAILWLSPSVISLCRHDESFEVVGSV